MRYVHGLLIVLDGPDASGTSTHAKLLAEHLQKEGRAVLLTSEPTDGPIGTEIREYLKGPQPGMAAPTTDPMELQLLFTKDRAWHVQNVIEPALAAGKIVVCDRYWHSTIVYAESQGLDSLELKNMNNKFVQPDIVLFTLPPLEVSLKRMAKRSSKDLFEREDLQRKIHAGYTRLAKHDSRVIIIDTSGQKEGTAAVIWKAYEANTKHA